jgi:dienelactone hydrolase
MSRGARAAGACLLALAVALVATAAWLGTRDPLRSLPADDPAAIAVLEEWPEAWHGRTLLHVALEGPSVGRARFVVSLPDPLPPRRIPLVVILGGLGGGSNSIRQISDVVGDPGPNAFVGYDWPLPTREPGVAEIVRRVPEFRRDVLSVPGQVDAILAWATRRAWADPGRLSLLGFSLGGFVVPAAQRIAQEHGVAIRWTALAYAGAPIGDVIAGHPKAGPRWVRRVLGAGADLLLGPVEPSNHLPHLRGRFLVLGAASDHLIARTPAERMEALTPEPRTVVRIAGDHMGVGADRWKLLARVVDVTRAWLVEQGAIDPPSPQAVRASPAP